MTTLSQIAEEYLELRNSLGHNLAEAHRLLPRFVAYLDSIGASTVTVEAALFWSQQPEAQLGTSVWARRMTIARGFSHMSGVDPRTEVPPPGLSYLPAALATPVHLLLGRHRGADGCS